MIMKGLVHWNLNEKSDGAMYVVFIEEKLNILLKTNIKTNDEP